MKCLALLLLVACGAHNDTIPPTTGSGSVVPIAGACEAVRAKVEGLYRAEAEAKEPKRVDAAVGDNTQMVMNDCAKDPPKVSACLQSAGTVAELESKCLRQLDDEGTEGNDLK